MCGENCAGQLVNPSELIFMATGLSRGVYMTLHSLSASGLGGGLHCLIHVELLIGQTPQQKLEGERIWGFLSDFKAVHCELHCVG